VADLLSFARLAIVVILWPVALAGHRQIVGLGLIAAGVTDALDGYAARRAGKVTARGARLDKLADTVAMLSAAAWLGILFPQITLDSWPLIALAVILYAGSIAAGGTDPKQPSGKAAGGLLYLFALYTLLTGVYEALLLDAALLALAVSSLQTIFIATRTIHAMARESSARSHAPQAAKGVNTSTPAAASIPISATPKNRL